MQKQIIEGCIVIVIAFFIISKLNSAQNSYKQYKKFMNSKLPNRSKSAQISDTVS